MALRTLAALRRGAALIVERGSSPPQWLEHVKHAEQCAPERARLILSALCIVYPQIEAAAKLDGLSRRSAEWLLHSAAPYRGAPPFVQARLVLGDSPAEISGGLTRHEAHRWLTEAPRSEPATWLLDQHDLGDHVVHSLKIARWLIACWRDPARRAALTRHRVAHGPHGEDVHGSYMSRLDELRDGDLRPSVEATFRRAGERLWKEIERHMKRMGEPVTSPPHWWRPIRCARLLLSPADLAREGQALGHCSAVYVPYLRSGRSVIVALNVLGERSTAEIERKTLRVRQHRGPQNSPAPELCRRALASCLRRWRKEGKRS